ncbi:MAG: sugar phosphate nucleotidyltransferase [Lachnospiraceae bacterium]|nr:sugar phosphate nucleotidyltransferase [Lachnospiraceae bacterium]
MTKESNTPQDKIDLFVPGRLCLFGEHSDWAGLQKSMNADIVPGYAIVTGIEQGIYGTAQKADAFSVTSTLPEYHGFSFSSEMDMNKLRTAAREGGFFSYVAGVASYICEWYHVGGLHLEITDMTLPMKSGLSSSAAICVMVAKAFNQLYDLHMNTLGLMNIAYWGEQRTPSRCGRLDQACAFGVNPVLMTFDGNELDVDRITVKKPLYYVFSDLMAGKDTVKILGDLNRGYPFAHNEMEERLHEALGKDNRIITSRAVSYLSSGDASKLGALMTEAQELFDEKVAPMCPEELTAPVLHSILNDPVVKSLTYGAKGVGSQGDGTVQFLARDEKTQGELAEYLRNKKGMTTYTLTLRPNTVVRRAVIPVAGFGTRLYPETRGVKKEFCPVVDKDGLVKPAILVLLEELDQIEIEEICLILNRDEKEYYEDFFLKPLPLEHYSKLSKDMKAYENKIRRISRKLRFVFQNEQKGFGHAVYQSRSFAAGEPVLLLLGDTIYHSNTSVPCTKQLLNAYEQFGQPMTAVHSVELPEVVHYGIFSGVWENKEETVLRLTAIAEKPSCEEARDYLSVAGRKRAENYYAAFGAYVITKDVYDRLDYAISQGIANDKGEIELTSALEYVRKEKGMMAFVPDGESYDIGNAEAYRKTVAEFGVM